MPLHAAAREILDQCFADTGWDRSDAGWRRAAFALNDCYHDAYQHGYLVQLEEINTWARDRGWADQDRVALVEMAHTVHYALIRAGAITR